MKIKFTLSEKILKASNNRMALGVLKANVVVTKFTEKLWVEIDNYLDSIKSKYDAKSLPELPEIKAVCDTYKTLGKSPKLFKGSNEALMLRVIQNKGLYKINTVVDVNNLISVKACRSLGSYDLEKLRGDIIFRPGLKGESYTGTTKRSVDLENLPLLSDNKGPFGSPTSDSSRALISESTTRVMTVIYSFDGVTGIEDQLSSLAQLFQEYSQATAIETFILKQSKMEDEFTSDLNYSDDSHSDLKDEKDTEEKKVAATDTTPSTGGSKSTQLTQNFDPNIALEKIEKYISDTQDQLSDLAYKSDLATVKKQFKPAKIREKIMKLHPQIDTSQIENYIQEVVSSVISQASGGGRTETVEYLMKEYGKYISPEDIYHCSEYAKVNGHYDLSELIKKSTST